MPPYYYYNTLDNKVSTTVFINFCQKIGPMSFCRAASIADQAGCKYREDAPSGRDSCLFYRETIDGACDSMWAQRGIEKPEPEPENEIVGTTVPPT
jgi:hypothetical protein